MVDRRRTCHMQTPVGRGRIYQLTTLVSKGRLEAGVLLIRNCSLWQLVVVGRWKLVVIGRWKLVMVGRYLLVIG